MSIRDKGQTRKLVDLEMHQMLHFYPANRLPKAWFEEHT